MLRVRGNFPFCLYNTLNDGTILGHLPHKMIAKMQKVDEVMTAKYFFT